MCLYFVIMRYKVLRQTKDRRISFSESAESMRLSKEGTKTSLNNSTASTAFCLLLLYTGYLRSVSSIQQRQVLEDVEQDLLRQVPPADFLLLRIFLPPLLAGAFQSLLGPTAGATPVLLRVSLQASFHPEYTEGVK